MKSLSMLENLIVIYDTYVGIQQSHRVNDDYDGGLYGYKNK